MSKRSEAVRAWRDIDDIIQIWTGKRIKDYVNRTVELIGDDIKKRVDKVAKGYFETDNDVIPVTGPYGILHCRPGASDAVVKLRFRELARILHPDTGTEPDAKEFQRVKEAYDEILAERKHRKPGNDSS